MCQFTDHFYAAVRRLAGDGSVKERLLSAYTENLEMLPDQDIPDSIRERFDNLRGAMHSAKPINGETPAVASIRKMALADAARHAKTIVAMFSELVRTKATGERVSVVKPDDKIKRKPRKFVRATLN